MASYLKFDGINDELRVTLTAPGNLTSVVMTAFLRFLTFPRFTAPVMRFVEHTGLWLRGSESPLTRQLAMQGSLDAADLLVMLRTTTGQPTVGATIPLRLGQIYKVQVVLAYDAAVLRHSLGFFVDGVKIQETFLTDILSPIPLWPMQSDIPFVIGGLTDGANDLYNAEPTVRGAHMDVIQAKFELNRTVTFNGSGGDRIPVLDADSDPFTDMTIDGSATDAGLYLMNEGTGTTVADTSGFGHSITIAGDSTAPDWAAAKDPSFPSTGVARWTFGSVEGYALRHSDAPDVVHQPIFTASLADKTAGELRLRKRPNLWWVDGHATTGWNVVTGLAASTAQSIDSGSSLLANNGSAVSDYDVPALDEASATVKRWMRAWFYDPGGTDASRLQRLALYNVTGGTINATIGVHISVSATHYSTLLNGPGGVASSVPFSVGWHEFMIYSEATGPSGPWAIRYYIDGTLVRTETATDIDQFFRAVGIRQAATGSDGDGYYDFWSLNDGVADADFVGLVPSTGTLVLPRMQPAQGVAYFRSVTVSEVTAGTNSMQRGTTLYECRHSINGGSSFGSFITLTNANLRSL